MTERKITALEDIHREFFRKVWTGHRGRRDDSVSNVYLVIPQVVVEEYGKEEIFKRIREDYVRHECVNIYLEIDGVTYAREESHADRCMPPSPFEVFEDGEGAYGHWQPDPWEEGTLFKEGVTVTKTWGAFSAGMTLSKVEIALSPGVVHGYVGDEDEEPTVSHWFCVIPQHCSITPQGED